MGQRQNFTYRNQFGVFYFQRRIPKSSLESTPQLPTFVRFSLRTKNNAEAKKLSRMFSVMFDLRAQQYFKTEESYNEAMKLFQEYVEAQSRFKTFEELERNFFDYLDDETGSDSNLLDSAQKYFNSKQIDKGINPYKDEAQDIQTVIKNAISEMNLGSNLNSRIQSVSLDDAFNEFINQKKVNWRPTGGMEDDFRKSYYPLFKGTVGEIRTNELSKAHIIEFVNVVLSYPSNKNKKPQYKDLGVKDFLKLNIPDKDKLHPTTKNKYLKQISSFLKWLKINDYTDIDLHLPITSVKIINNNKDNENKDVFSKSELKAIFNSEIYKKGLHKSPSKFWVPLLGLYTGARLNEICQLSTSDVYLEEDTSRWVISFNIDESDDPKKSLKKIFHKRLFPIHKKIIELGFLRYLDYVKKSKSKKLFPELPYVSHVNKYGDRITKWFNRTYLRSQCKVDNVKTSFHSFRHTLITHLVNDKEVDANKIAEAVGQTPQGGVTQRIYTKKLPLKDYIKYIDLIDFDDCFDHKLIRPWEYHTFMRASKNSKNPVQNLNTRAKSIPTARKTTKKPAVTKKVATKTALSKTKST